MDEHLWVWWDDGDGEEDDDYDDDDETLSIPEQFEEKWYEQSKMTKYLF